MSPYFDAVLFNLTSLDTLQVGLFQSSKIVLFDFITRNQDRIVYSLLKLKFKEKDTIF